MPSFDIVSEANQVEVRNAVDQANKEITTRFDFKGSDARVEQKEHELTAYADSDFQLGQVRDVLTNKMAKRNVDVRFLDLGKIEKIGGDKVKQVIKVKNGIETDAAKKIQRIIKDSKIKVQASIQGESVRVQGAKRDDLQATIALLKKEVTDLPLEFNNFRDSEPFKSISLGCPRFLHPLINDPRKHWRIKFRRSGEGRSPSKSRQWMPAYAGMTNESAPPLREGSKHERRSLLVAM